jgi:hypothetical protein
MQLNEKMFVPNNTFKRYFLQSYGLENLLPFPVIYNLLAEKAH